MLKPNILTKKLKFGFKISVYMVVTALSY